VLLRSPFNHDDEQFVLVLRNAAAFPLLIGCEHALVPEALKGGCRITLRGSISLPDIQPLPLTGGACSEQFENTHHAECSLLLQVPTTRRA
jgi:hypothetical protein